MKAILRVFKPLEGAVCVCLKVGIVDEIKDTTGCLYNFWVSHVSSDTEKHLFHVLVLILSPLRDEGDPSLSGPTSSLVTWRPVKSIACVICVTAEVPQVFAKGKLLPLLYDGVARGWRAR